MFVWGVCMFGKCNYDLFIFSLTIAWVLTLNGREFGLFSDNRGCGDILHMQARVSRSSAFRRKATGNGN